MKKILCIAMFGIAMLAAPVVSKAQAVAAWPAGKMTVASVTATTKVPSYTVTPTNSCYEINITVDTSLVINFAGMTKLKAGDIIYVKVTNGATAATRTVTGNTKCTMKAFTMTSAKTHMFTFVHDGTNAINTGGLLVN